MSKAKERDSITAAATNAENHVLRARLLVIGKKQRLLTTLWEGDEGLRQRVKRSLLEYLDSASENAVLELYLSDNIEDVLLSLSRQDKRPFYRQLVELLELACNGEDEVYEKRAKVSNVDVLVRKITKEEFVSRVDPEPLLSGAYREIIDASRQEDSRGQLEQENEKQLDGSELYIRFASLPAGEREVFLERLMDGGTPSADDASLSTATFPTLDDVARDTREKFTAKFIAVAREEGLNVSRTPEELGKELRALKTSDLTKTLDAANLSQPKVAAILKWCSQKVSKVTKSILSATAKLLGMISAEQVARVIDEAELTPDQRQRFHQETDVGATMTLAKAAKYLDVTPKSITRYAENGRLGYTGGKEGVPRKYLVKDLDRLMGENLSPGGNRRKS